MALGDVTNTRVLEVKRATEDTGRLNEYNNSKK